MTKKNNNSWWDNLFLGGFLSFLLDAEEARHDDKKFRSMLFQLLFGVIFTVLVFAVAFWIVN